MRIKEIIKELDISARPDLGPISTPGQKFSQQTQPLGPQQGWEQLSRQLIPRARDILNKLVTVAGVDRRWLQQIRISTDSSETGEVTYAFKTRPDSITLTPILARAPDSVIAFILGHELGHIITKKKGVSPYVLQQPVNPDQKRELEADRWGAQLAMKLGYNKAEVFAWLKNATHSRNSRDVDDPDASHPSDQRRIDTLNRNVPGFTLGALDQIRQTLAEAPFTKQLELPLGQALAKGVEKQLAKQVPKRVEYTLQLPGEDAWSRPTVRKVFNSDEEAQEFIRRKNATPISSKTID